MKNQFLRILLLIAAIVCFNNNIMAQKKMYASVNVGYGIKMGTQTMLDNFKQTSTNGYVESTSKAIDVSYGKGLNFGAAFGYMFTKNIGAELDVTYLLGGKTKANTDITTIIGPITSHRTSDRILSANMFRIIPTLVIDAGLEKLDPYAKLGFLVGLGSIKYYYNENDDGDVTVQRITQNGGVALGLSSTAGVRYNINDMMSVFAELNMVNLSYSPTKGKITERTVNGVDMLPGMTTRDKETVYLKEITSKSTEPIPDSEPNKELKTKMPFSSFGINVGFRINF